MPESQDFLNTTFRTVAWFRKHNDEGTLEIQPAFQRHAVWTDAQKSYLIDTILHGYPIPELYMQEIVNAAGEENQVIVDGQQRIRACLDFIDGEYKINTKQASRSRWHGLKFEQLDDSEKIRLFGYRFVVRILPAIEPARIGDIFKRLNRVVEALTQQELRHATYWGDFIECLESIANWKYWSTTGLFTPLQTRRMTDVEYISELAVAVINGPQNKKESLDKYYRLYEEEFNEPEALANLFRRITGELYQVLPDLRRTRWRKKSDFYTLFLLFARLHQLLPFASDQRAAFTRELIVFGEAVDRYQLIRDDPNATDEIERIPHYIREYSRAVERAASDASNRKERLRSLSEAIKVSPEIQIDLDLDNPFEGIGLETIGLDFEDEDELTGDSHDDDNDDDVN